jgi:hypothetical protein
MSTLGKRLCGGILIGCLALTTLGWTPTAAAASRLRTTTVTAVASGSDDDPPGGECQVFRGTDVQVTGTFTNGKGPADWGIQYQETSGVNCGGLDEFLYANEKLDPGEFQFSKRLNWARLDAELTFQAFTPEGNPPFKGHLAVQWTASNQGIKTIVIDRTTTPARRTVTLTRPAVASSPVGAKIPGYLGSAKFGSASLTSVRTGSCR